MAKTKQSEFDLTTARPVRVPKALREMIEAALEKHIAATESLTALLDRIDGDPNLEEQCEDEGAQCEDEGDVDGSGSSDKEPELGWTESINQMRNKSNKEDAWGIGGEPSLGSRDGMINQAVWGMPGDTGDREQQCEDEGFDTTQIPGGGSDDG